MKITGLSLIALFIVRSVFAGEVMSATKLKTFLNKNHPCLLAVGLVNDQKSAFADKGTILIDILCVANLTVGEGTIDEKAGCALSKYNPHSDSFSGMGPYGQVMPIADKPCESGGLQKVLTKAIPEMGGLTGADALRNGALIAPYAAILYSDSPKYIDLYRKYVGKIQLK